ncbi:MAG: hypothetical protein NTX35_17100 [Verrucomicrobia bacterium]|nr:hypothetical protein [Verrucomicrobiota bacterium]
MAAIPAVEIAKPLEVRVGEIYGDPNTASNAWRALWIDPQGSQIMVFALHDPKAFPEPWSLSELRSKLASRRLVRVDNHPADHLIARKIDVKRSRCHELEMTKERFLKEVGSKNLKIVDDSPPTSTNWELIKGLVTSEPAAYLPKARGAYIRKLEADGVSTRPTLFKLLRRYWASGKQPISVEPNNFLKGGVGKARPAKAGGPKRGAPSKLAEDGEEYGINVSETHKKWIRESARYLSTECNISDAYEKFRRKHFRTSEFKMVHGKRVPILLHPKHCVSLTAYRYWLHKLVGREQILRGLHGDQWFELNGRGLLGGAMLLAFGPAHTYEIDATVLDLYVVSRINRNYVIGRPIVYHVMDRYSKMFVGLHVSFDGPNFESACGALLNAFEDKVEFCKRYGIQIKHGDWPCNVICGELIADGGELRGALIEGGIGDLKFGMSTLPAYRGDLKSLVEKSFHISKETSVKFIPGRTLKNVAERDQKHPSKLAVLDIDQLMKILITDILWFNNEKPLASMPEDLELHAVMHSGSPRDVWNWGMVNRTGAVRAVGIDILRAALLPIAKAAVTKKGVSFNGKNYIGERVITEGWAVRARSNGVSYIDVRYDRRNPEQIRYRAPDGTIDVLELNEAAPRYGRFNFEEIACADEAIERGYQRRKADSKQGVADQTAFRDAVVKEGTKQTRTQDGPKPSSTGRSAGMKDRQRIAKEDERSQGGKRFAEDNARLMGRATQISDAEPVSVPELASVPAAPSFKSAQERHAEELLERQRQRHLARRGPGTTR